MLLKAEFLAIALVLVYVGAVMVLFLFVVMMLDINVDDLRRLRRHFRLRPWSAVIALGDVDGADRRLPGRRVAADRGCARDGSNTRALGSA